MARKIYDEDIRLNLILNGEGLNKGSKLMVAELGKLEQEMVALENKAKILSAEIKVLSKDETGNAAILKSLRAEYASVRQAIDAQTAAIGRMRQEVGLAGMTVQQLRTHIAALKTQLYNMPASAGSSIVGALQKELKDANIRLTTLTTGASRFSQAWRNIENSANRAGTIMGWFAVGSYLVGSAIGSVVSRMMELEDLIGSVRKNTNLMTSQAWELKDEFDKWDTRTKTDDLLKLAVVAGKLGIEGKENIRDFVQAANMIQIALGDDLQGSIEDTVTAVGKLMNAFRVEKDMPLATAMMRTGDVLNQLAKSSAASAGTILQYMTRLSAVSELAGFTIAQIGGIGSVLDALNIPAERGSTAMQRIMLQLGNPKKVAGFAEALMQVNPSLNLVNDSLGTMSQHYAELLKNDPNYVMTTLLQKLVSTKDGLVQLNGGFADFGINGQRMVSTLGALAINLDVLKEQQDIAAKAWKDQNSILNEYNIMNYNFTAEVMKQQKAMKASGDMMNREMEPAVMKLVKAGASFVIGMRETIMWLGQHMQLIKDLAAAYLLLKAPMVLSIANQIVESLVLKEAIIQKKLSAFWTQMSMLATKEMTVAQEAQIFTSKVLLIAHIALTKGIKEAWIALKAMTAAEMLVPWAAIAIAVAALGGAIYALVKGEGALSETQKTRLSLQDGIARSVAEEKANLDVLMGRLKDVNISEGERHDIIKQIQEIYSKYLPSLKMEGTTVDDITKSYTRLNEAMQRKIIYEAYYKASVENGQKMLLLGWEMEKIQKQIDEDQKNSKSILNPNDEEVMMNAMILSKHKDQLDEKKKLYKEEAEFQKYLDSGMSQAAPSRETVRSQEDFLRDHIADGKAKMEQIKGQIEAVKAIIKLKETTEGGLKPFVGGKSPYKLPEEGPKKEAAATETAAVAPIEVQKGAVEEGIKELKNEGIKAAGEGLAEYKAQLEKLVEGFDAERQAIEDRRAKQHIWKPWTYDFGLQGDIDKFNAKLGKARELKKKIEELEKGTAGAGAATGMAPQEADKNVLGDQIDQRKELNKTIGQTAEKVNELSEAYKKQAEYGLRADGTKKGNGYFGPLQRPDGGVSTEIGIGVQLNGKETEIPTLVPTLTEEEKQYLLKTATDQIMTADANMFKDIQAKAIDYAKKRLSEGKSPFADNSESPQAITATSKVKEPFEGQAPQVDDLVKFIASFEGKYDSIAANDNGALSIGKMQWHADRAKDLLTQIKEADLDKFKEITGDYYEGISTLMQQESWKETTLEGENSMYADVIKNVLDSQAGKEVQDKEAVKNTQAALGRAKNLGISSAGMQWFFAELENQKGASQEPGLGAKGMMEKYAEYVKKQNISELSLDDVKSYYREGPGKEGNQAENIRHYSAAMKAQDMEDRGQLPGMAKTAVTSQPSITQVGYDRTQAEANLKQLQKDLDAAALQQMTYEKNYEEVKKRNAALKNDVDDETFKKQVDKRKAQYESEEADIKQQANAELWDEDHKNARLIHAKVVYLSDTKKLMEESGRIYDADQATYDKTRNELADAIWEENNKKKRKIGKEAQEAIEKNNQIFADKQLELAGKFRRHEIEDEEAFNEQKAEIERAREDALMPILEKFGLKRSDLTEQEANQEIKVNDAKAKKELADNNASAAKARTDLSESYDKGDIKGRQNYALQMLNIERQRLAQELEILKRYNLDRTNAINAQAANEVNMRNTEIKRGKEIADQIEKDADTTFKNEVTKRQIQFNKNEIDTKQYNRDILDLEIQKYTTMQGLLDTYIKDEKYKPYLDALVAMNIEVIGKIAQLKMQAGTDEVKNADKTGQAVNREFSGRSKNFMAKYTELGRSIREVDGWKQRDGEKDDVFAARKNDAIAERKKLQLDLAKTEAYTFAMSTAAAMENAKSYQDAAAIMLNAIRAKIEGYIAEAVASAMVNSIALGPAGLFLAPIAAAAVTLLFETLVPKFGTDSSGNMTSSTLGSRPQKAEGDYPIVKLEGMGKRQLAMKELRNEGMKKYPIIGADDGVLYQAAMGGSPETDVYDRPTLLNMAGGQTLVGEKAPELVVDGNTFRRIQINAPQLVRDIYAYAGKGPQIRQNAEGSYPVTGSKEPPTGFGTTVGAGNKELLAAINKLNGHLDRGIKASAVFNNWGTNGLNDAMDKIKQFKARTGKK